MKIGVSAFAWTADLKESHLDLLPLLCEHGLSAFEVPMFDPGKLPAVQIRRTTEANDIACTVCAILPPGINPISADAEIRKQSLSHLVRCVEVCSEMGAKLMGGPVYAPIGYLPARRRQRRGVEVGSRLLFRPSLPRSILMASIFRSSLSIAPKLSS